MNISIPVNMYNLEPVQKLLVLMHDVATDSRMPQDLGKEMIDSINDIITEGQNGSPTI
jgi:hypothetical protein